jgi:cholesterol oxidase
MFVDEHTHIEAVRYPAGSDSMAFLTTILTNGRPGLHRIALWLKNILLSLLRHPLKTLRVLQPFGWAREFVILLCMQALDSEIEMRWQRLWFWPFRKFLVSRGAKIPTYIPKANEFAQKYAQLTGGFAMSLLPEILFDVPGTAHCIGGCVIADAPNHGVVDPRQRVFNYKNMYICDGSVVAANLGVNPSLTITALAERAMSFIPLAAQTDWNDSPEHS